jgi:excisionase family DNA binding protein
MNDPTLETLAELVAERVARRPVPKRAMTRAQAAESLSVSVDHFERYVQPEIRVLRVGRLVLIPAAELDAWIDRNAALTLGGSK